jgi:hypothetical protein
MNLLCPSCQNPLSVPEQYAGQLMKCPLCNNNFTVPPLPDSHGEPILNIPEAEPEAHDSQKIDLTTHAPAPATPPEAREEAGPSLYGMTPEPTPAPKRAPAAAVSNSAPSPPPPATNAPAPATSYKPTPPRQRQTPGGYTHTMALSLNPQVVPWIAPACLFLVFILSFFPWVGYYHGHYDFLSQSAWGAAFGGYSIDGIFEHETDWDTKTKPEDKPGVGFLMVFFLIFGLLPALTVAVAVVALPRLQGQFNLPAGVAGVMPWRWLIVAGITCVPLFFLLLQLVVSFSIESRTRDAIDREFARKSVSSGAIAAQWTDMQEAKAVSGTGLHRTSYMRFSLVLLVIAALGAVTAHWIERRGPSRPLPRVEILW